MCRELRKRGTGAEPLSDEEAGRLFADLHLAKSLILAVSGGPDSTAMLVLAARWRASLRDGPRLWAVTVDHGLRPESAREALMVKRLANRLGVPHITRRWIGRKPKTAIQETARSVRYRFLGEAARRVGARHVLTAHTLDDQAETMLFRMARGSGLTGLTGIARRTPLQYITLVRPFLEVSKARLIATLQARRIPFVQDPSNRDDRFARPRWRHLMPALAAEGLGAERLARLAQRLSRAEAALEAEVDSVIREMPKQRWQQAGTISLDASRLSSLPDEIGLRVLGRAVAHVGTEGTVKLGRLEALFDALSSAIRAAPKARFRRTLAGALVSLQQGRIEIAAAPKRRHAAKRRSPIQSGLT